MTNLRRVTGARLRGLRRSSKSLTTSTGAELDGPLSLVKVKRLTVRLHTKRKTSEDQNV